MSKDPRDNVGVGRVDENGPRIIPEPPESPPPGKLVPYRPKGWPKNCIILPSIVLDPPEPRKRRPKEPE